VEKNTEKSLSGPSVSFPFFLFPSPLRAHSGIARNLELAGGRAPTHVAPPPPSLFSSSSSFSEARRSG